MIGGVATSVCTDSEFLMPNRTEPGDAIVLTKPLGTQVVVNAYQWMLSNHKFWHETLMHKNSTSDIHALYKAAVFCMTRLNRNAAELMHKHGARACTDVTGFGVIGHSENLVKAQLNQNICFKLHRMPYLSGTVDISLSLDDRFKVKKGLCPETSGGLLVVLPSDNVSKYCKELEEIDGAPCWHIGNVLVSEDGRGPYVQMADDIEFISVDPASITSPVQN